MIYQIPTYDAEDSFRENTGAKCVTFRADRHLYNLWSSTRALLHWFKYEATLLGKCISPNMFWNSVDQNDLYTRVLITNLLVIIKIYVYLFVTRIFKLISRIAGVHKQECVHAVAQFVMRL